MTTDVALASAPAMDAQIQKAKLMAEASILPEAYRKQPANILVAMEAAETLRITLFQAINGIDVIKGRMAMKPEMMRALILRDGHRFHIDAQTAEGARITVARAENPDDEQVFEYTMADARLAGLAGNDNYKRIPKSMMLARCTSLAARAVFPDVVAGIGYTPDEIRDEPDRQSQPRTVDTSRLRARTPAPAPMPTDIPGVVVDGDGVMWDAEEAEVIDE